MRGTGVDYRFYLDGTLQAGSRVQDWGVVRKEINSDGLFSSQWEIEIIDTDSLLANRVNTWKGGTHPVYYPTEVWSTNDGAVSWNRQWSGRIQSYSWRDGIYSLSSADELKSLANNRFLWNYEALGQIGAWSGSFVFFQSAAMKATFCPFGGTEGTGGERIKFNNTEVIPDTGTSIGRAIRENSTYTVRKGTWISSHTPNAGTLEIDPPLAADTAQYAYLYNREPLVFSGHPGTIIERMLTDPNVIWTPYQSSDFGVIGTESILQFDFLGTIEDEGTGGVAREIFEICSNIMADFYVGKTGTFVLDVWRPKKLWETVQGTWKEGTHIVEQGIHYFGDYTDVYTACRVEYRYDDNAGTYNGVVEGTLDPTSLHGLHRTKTIQSKWIKDRSEAQVICDRFLAYHKRGLVKYGIRLTPDVYNVEVGEDWLLINQGDVSRLASLRAYSKDFQNDRVDAELRDEEHFYKRGWAWWDVIGAGGGLVETVTNDSISGWGSVAPDMTNPCPGAEAGTGTVFRINVDRHGTVFVWW